MATLNPQLSIVMAAGEGSRGLTACLESLGRQRNEAIEVLIVTADPALLEAAARFEWTRSVPSDGHLVPELWRDGIDAARGDLVALTTADHIPDRGWVQAILASQSSCNAAAIGGLIAPPDRSVVCRAVWFLRYSGLALTHGARDVSDLAADNVSYKRAALVRHAAAYRDGFWEPAVHQRMIASGERLKFDPSITVTLGSAPPPGRFLVQRFRHGIRFGRWRAREFHSATRVAAIIVAPLIPIVFLAKIARRAVRLPGLRLQFALSLPALVCLVVAWSLGEARGYVSAPWRPAAERPAPHTRRAPVGTIQGYNAGT